MPRSLTLRLSLSCLVLGIGCHRPSTTPSVSSAPPRVPGPSEVTIKTYPLVGVVKRVTPAAGQVLIAHEAIPGFMDAMTMPFSVKDHSLLDDVQPGDEVEGPLRVETRGGVVTNYALEDLIVTRPAPASPKRLGFSAQGLELRPEPRRLEPGQEVPDFSMTTQEGRALKLSDLKGQVVVLTFIYTRCPLPDFCPLMDRKFASLAEKLAASPGRSGRVRLLSVSFDPEHDTPEVLTKHAQVQGAQPPLWTFAVASHPELAKVAAPLGLTYGPLPNEIMHNLCTAVIDPRGRLARLYLGTSGRSWQPSELMPVLSGLLAP